MELVEQQPTVSRSELGLDQWGRARETDMWLIFSRNCWRGIFCLSSEMFRLTEAVHCSSVMPCFAMGRRPKAPRPRPTEEFCPVRKLQTLWRGRRHVCVAWREMALSHIFRVVWQSQGTLFSILAFA